jgi:membrane protease YdiL (CAAX protease family)
MTTVNIVTVAKRNILARYPLLSFFVLAVALSWTIALPSLVWDLPFKPFQTLGAFGPLLAAIIVTTVEGGEALKALFRRMTIFRFGAGWYLLAIFGYAGLYLMVAGLSGAPLGQALAGRWMLLITLYLPGLFTTYLINSIGEETGWTGFAVHELQQRFRPWLAAILLGLLWAVWHLPAYFVPSEMGAFNPAGFLIFTLSLIFTRVIWTWVTNRARGSGIAGILLHASSNAVSLGLIPKLLPAPTPEQMAVSGLILLGLLLGAAGAIVIFTRGRL